MGRPTTIHSLMESDPCYGCKFAKQKEEIRNYFERKYWCINFYTRVARAINDVRLAIARIDGSGKWDENLAEMMMAMGQELTFAGKMVSDKLQYGRIDPVDTVVRCPFYKKAEEKQSEDSQTC